MSTVTSSVFSGGAPAKPGFPKRSITTPFRRDQKADLANASGSALIRSHVRQILGTKVGEVPWLPELGSQLYTLKHQRNSPILENIAQVLVIEALETWEPRAKVIDVTVDHDGRSLTVSVVFDVVNPSAIGYQLIDSGVQEDFVLTTG